MEWYKINNKKEKVPSNIEFSREIKKKIQIEKVTINGMTQEGIVGYKYKNINS